MDNQTIKPTGCCAPFEPAPWTDQEITWDNKLFAQGQVRCLFHIPLNMGQVMTRMCAKIKGAGADVRPEDFVMLSEENSPWRSVQYMSVGKEVPGLNNVRISGTFLTKVFEGPYKDAGKWAKEMVEYAKGKGKEIKKLFFSYTTCPKCAKAYGKNYVVLFAQVD